jgi:hypothetical protein
MDIAGILAGVVAVIALLFSFYKFYVGRRDRRTRLVVQVSQDTRTNYRGLFKVVRIDITNLSQRHVTISAVRILWGKESLTFPNVVSWASEPFKLDPYDGRRSMVVSEHIVASALREKGASGRIRIKASCQDKLGRVYLSKKYAINIDEWVEETA